MALYRLVRRPSFITCVHICGRRLRDDAASSKHLKDQSFEELANRVSWQGIDRLDCVDRESVYLGSVFGNAEHGDFLLLKVSPVLLIDEH